MIETASSFLNYRINQESALFDENNVSSKLPGLISIEINITELCNRTCYFCPRAFPEKYPNRNVHMSNETFNRICTELINNNYKSKISFSGFGEPLLNKRFVFFLKELRKSLGSDVIIETNSNGDFLTTEVLNELFDAGLSSIYWNLYDGEHQLEPALKVINRSRFPSENIRIRPHWSGIDLEQEAGLILNNRSGMVSSTKYAKNLFPLKKGCNYPFYKMLIDWDGNVLCCSNDWGRKRPMGNIMNLSLSEIWLSDAFMLFRKNLVNKDRSQAPCSSCDINGELFGERSVRIIKDLML